MVGNPGENPENIAETIALLKALRPATMPTIGITTLLPGSQIYKRAKRQGLTSEESWLTESLPPLYTGEQSSDDRIALQFQRTKGVLPEMRQQLRAMRFDKRFFELRRMCGLGVFAA